MAAPSPKRARKDASPAKGASPAKSATVFVVTRKSPLAMQQTNHVVGLLRGLYPEVRWEIAPPKETVGDKQLDKPLAAIGDKGLFTKELEDALHAGTARLAVHSCKDLQTNLPAGLTIGAFLKRDEKEDVLIVRKGLQEKCKTLDDLPAGSVVGTSSLRRRAVLGNLHPQLQFKDIRGNIGTRLRKLDDESNGYSATILAHAGLSRMNTPEYTDRITQVLPEQKYLYAVAQGALAVECRADDVWLLERLQRINCTRTEQCCRAERSLMRTLEGGCHVPIGVTCQHLPDGRLSLYAKVLNLNGTKSVDARGESEAAAGDELGARIARELKDKGADALLKKD
eukprot:TRINITY_DN55749_c0_g1_i1.p1 TRINITY_DN55749_c0_g1~~TRINITY_DN55749_c0_g1_i1.p1  ORF type:complete len:340 (+),score=120.91 TRINITY_DN55749_c0_g1_i1:74-1093(+)